MDDRKTPSLLFLSQDRGVFPCQVKITELGDAQAEQMPSSCQDPVLALEIRKPLPELVPHAVILLPYAPNKKPAAIPSF